jgi:hypothetical protein
MARNIPTLWGDFEATSMDRGRKRLNVFQLAVDDVLRRVLAQGWQAWVVGGTLRDLVSGSSMVETGSIIPRDVDIVVTNVSLQDLQKYFWDLIIRHTRFGGLHLVKNLVGICQIHFDIWPLAETWAFRHLSLEPQMSNFILTPFLNLDAVAIELYPDPGRSRVVLPGLCTAGLPNADRAWLISSRIE